MIHIQGNLQFDYDVLQLYKQQKKLKMQTHPLYNLAIWNYAEFVQYSHNWDEVTKHCRGTITDFHGNIIARSFPKFFNMEELSPEEIPTNEPYKVFQKVDGSLGILFYYAPSPQEGQWIFASRGSFTSDQSTKAMQILQTQHPEFDQILSKTKSYIFEIIYPENRIVVNYGSDEKLIYLTTYDNLTGLEDITERPAMASYGFHVVKEIEPIAPKDLKAQNIENEEGYVVRFQNGLRMKIKFENYLKLHKTVSNLTPKTIYEWLRDQKTTEEMAELVPDEFIPFFNDVVANIQSQYDTIYKVCVEFISGFTVDPTNKDLKKQFFLQIAVHPYKAALAVMFNDPQNYDRLHTTIYNKYITYNGLSTLTNVTSTKPYVPTAQLICLIGVSGSGKSTWAAEYVRNHSRSLIVSRDSIRQALYGLATDNDIEAYYASPNFNDREKMVTVVQAQLIDSGLENRYTVIVDNTNLNETYLRAIRRPEHVPIHYKRFPLLSIDELLTRIQTREKNTKITRKILEKQIKQYNDLPETFTNIEYNPITPIEQDSTLPKCVVFDIDGTLALNKNGRSPYDMSRVGEDVVNEPISTICRLMYDVGYHIVICSGRTADAREATVAWLSQNRLHYHALHFRDIGNKEADYVVKERMWRTIAKTHYIEAMYDDRNQVVNHARKLGFTVCQVAEGNF